MRFRSPESAPNAGKMTGPSFVDVKKWGTKLALATILVGCTAKEDKIQEPKRAQPIPTREHEEHEEPAEVIIDNPTRMKIISGRSLLLDLGETSELVEETAWKYERKNGVVVSENLNGFSVAIEPKQTDEVDFLKAGDVVYFFQGDGALVIEYQGLDDVSLSDVTALIHRYVPDEKLRKLLVRGMPDPDDTDAPSFKEREERLAEFIQGPVQTTNGKAFIIRSPLLEIWDEREE
jgi:hypothetical protein